MTAQIPLTGSLGPTGPFAILGFSLPVITGNADHVLTVSEYSSTSLKVTSDGTSTAIRKLVAPLAPGMLFLVENLTSEGFAITVGGASGAAVTVPSGATVLVTCPDGANYVAPGGGAGAQTIVANAAGLTALPASGLRNGTTAVVQTFGALFALSAAGPTVDGVTVIAASDGRVWQRGPSLVVEAALAQTTWFVNFASGSDEATGLATGTALKTYAEIVRRWGTTAPASSPTITWIGDGGPNDCVTLNPSNGNLATLLGTLVAGASLTLGTFTAQNPAAGTKNLINVAATTWTVGQLVRDTTKSATFFIDANVGGGTAQITNPVAFPIAITGPVVPKTTMAAGDTLTFYTLPVVQFVECSYCVIQNLAIAGGPFGSPEFGLNVFVSECATAQNASIITDNSANDIPSPAFMSCYFFPSFGAGSFTGSAQFSAGSIANGVGSQHESGTNFDFDVILNVRGHFDGNVTIRQAYFGDWWTDTGGPQGYGTYVVGTSQSGGASRVWGPAVIRLTGSQQFRIRGTAGTAAATLLCTGGISMNGAGTAYTFNTATGTFSAGAVALTPAAVDTNVTMCNPLSGARIAIG